MMLRRSAFLAVFFLMMVSSAFPEPSAEQTLDSLIAEALENNPSLQAARYQKLSTETRISQAKAWEAPQIGVEFPLTPTSSFPNPFKDSMETDYFIQQKIPFPGKTGIMAMAEQSGSDMAAHNVKALENAVIKDLKKTYYDLCLLQRKIILNRESQDLMRRFSELARKQYELGKGTQADVLRAQTELSMLINEGNTMRQEKKTMETMIGALTGRPKDQPGGPFTDLDESFIPADLTAIPAAPHEKRPELQAMAENIRMKDAEHALAKRDYYPDIMLRLMYKRMEEGPDDYFSTMISVDLPFLFMSGGKIRGRVEESRLNVLKAREDLRAMENMARYQVEEAVNTAENHRRTMEFYRTTVIPQAVQARESMGSAYATGKAELFELIESLRTELGARESYYSSLAEWLKALADLEQAEGRDSGIHARKDPAPPELQERNTP